MTGSPPSVDSGSSRPRWVALGLLALLTLGEIRIFQRLLFEGTSDSDFVLVNVGGVLEGRPVSASWQQRLVAPAAVAALGRLTGDRRVALELFGGAMLAVANLVLYVVTLRKGRSRERALGTVALFVLLRALLLYRLEYPWDAVDILIFLALGHWAWRGGPLLGLWPLLLVGTINHETILYVPLFYLLGPLDRYGRPPRHSLGGGDSARSARLVDRPASRERRELVVATLASLVMGGCILLLRRRLYVGQPNLPGQIFEEPTPLIGNHLHVVHNLRQLFFANWISLRMFVSATVLTAMALLVVEIRRGERVRAAVWSFVVIATIVCFGYVNETRHYLVLLAFWFAYV
jgi:hypothetical protein